MGEIQWLIFKEMYIEVHTWLGKRITPAIAIPAFFGSLCSANPDKNNTMTFTALITMKLRVCKAL